MDPSPIPPSTPLQPVDQTPTSPPIPTKQNNWLIISLVIFIIILSLGTAGYFAYQNIQLKNQIAQKNLTPFVSPKLTAQAEDPTTNWKTYNSGNYEIKYPPDAVVGEAPTSDYITISYGDPRQNPGTDCRNGGCDNLPPPLLTIGIDSRFSKQNIDSVAETERQKALNIGKQSEITSLSVAGIPAKFFEGAGNGYFQNYIVENKTLHYFLVISVGYRNQPDVAVNKKLADQILSTFKFTDQTTDTANWKTYTDTNGFSIKYPPAWTINPQGQINSNDKYPPDALEPVTYWVNWKYISNPSNKQFKDIATDGLDKTLVNNFTYSTETINGLTAYRTTSLPSRLGCEWVFFKSPQNNYVSTNFCYYDKDKPFTNQAEHYAIYNQILSTFQFTTK